ncbi:MAG: hypothetical protein KDA32_02635 [Phycisphaerales bacterium]|nr:hypothetical protein [Phycisphaerales bacterium]
MFNYEWFYCGGLDRLVEEATHRCARARYPNWETEQASEYEAYKESLEKRTILYMKDGLTYEMREMAEVGTSSALAFECLPVDENYHVGAIVIIAPFEDIARVEVFAVHPDEKPTENLRIPGFRPPGAKEPQS